jgi:branched-subunit amino acid aminotransferase/4-amino-4-deoxychorismate lyase
MKQTGGTMLMSTPLVYLNGRFIPQGEAHIGLNDAGFVFGATVTDLARTFHHHLFRFPDHLARFRQSCHAARIPLRPTDEALMQATEQVVQHNAGWLPPDQDLALVLIATPGPIGYYSGQSGGPGEAAPTVCVHTFPIPYARYTRLFHDGARLIVPGIQQIPAACVDPRIKQRSRLHWWLADHEARETDPEAFALLADFDDHVTETAFANFLIVRRGTVVSPPRATIIDGISLRVTEELCQENSIPFTESPLTVDNCLAADEAMLTGTMFCLAGVRSINGTRLPWPGPVTDALAAAWAKRVGCDYRCPFLAARPGH